MGGGLDTDISEARSRSQDTNHGSVRLDSGQRLVTRANGPTKLYDKWADYSSTPRVDPETFLHEALRKEYPNHSLLTISGYTDGGVFSVLTYPEAVAIPMHDVPSIIRHGFAAVPRRAGPGGVLYQDVQFGVFNVAWKAYDFIVYAVEWPQGFGSVKVEVILHNGPESVIRDFSVAAGAYANALHDQIWVFNQGFWQKDHSLWLDIQRASWDDIIMKDSFKKTVRDDIEGFFDSEALYKKYALPWKRGVIMHGPPGDGKTISLKAIMKSSKYPSLYVRSFQSYKGEEGAMTDVFNKAREYAPCLVILEDLDTLITERNRSFFLNQIDGLQGNDGLLVLATTNYLDKLDPSLSKRPSRFDRKFFFDDPDLDERKQYARYWQKKLANNAEVSFPDSLIDKIAALTERFSFAYLKEAFVSSLVTVAKAPGKRSFEEIIVDQIHILRAGLGSSLGLAY